MHSPSLLRLAQLAIEANDLLAASSAIGKLSSLMQKAGSDCNTFRPLATLQGQVCSRLSDITSQASSDNNVYIRNWRLYFNEIYDVVAKKPWLFDVNHYSSNVSELALASALTVQPLREALEHYLEVGWRYSCNPSPFFSNSAYSNYMHCSMKGAIPPLAHYILSRSSLRPVDTLAYLDSRAGIPVSQGISQAWPSVKICVVVHAYYHEKVEYIFHLLRKGLPSSAAIMVSTPSVHSKRVRELATRYLSQFAHVNVLEFPNRGRDIAPFVLAFGHEVLRYDYVLKLHTKRSIHDHRLAGWGDHCLWNLVGNSRIARNCVRLLNDGFSGMVYPVAPYEVALHLTVCGAWGEILNLSTRSGHLVKALNIDPYLTHQFGFPAGSMFWAHTKVLEPLVGLSLSLADFEPESGQNDCTLAHGIERLLGSVCTQTYGLPVSPCSHNPLTWR